MTGMWRGLGQELPAKTGRVPSHSKAVGHVEYVGAGLRG